MIRARPDGASEEVSLKIGQSRAQLHKRVWPEARAKVVNHGLFPILLVAFCLAPCLFLLHPLARLAEVMLGWWYMLTMPVLVVAWSIVPWMLYRRAVREACDTILLREGVVFCPHCAADLRRFTWDTTLDPICPNCEKRFDLERRRILLEGPP